jgi:hypothetical protein
MQVRPAAGGLASAVRAAAAAAARAAPATTPPADAEARGLLPARGRAGPRLAPVVPGTLT